MRCQIISFSTEQLCVMPDSDMLHWEFSTIIIVEALDPYILHTQVNYKVEEVVLTQLMQDDHNKVI